MSFLRSCPKWSVHVPRVPTQSFLRMRSSTLSTAFLRPPLPCGLGSICQILFSKAEIWPGVTLGGRGAEAARRDEDRLCLRRRRAVDWVSGWAVWCFFSEGVSGVNANRVSFVNGLEGSSGGERDGVWCLLWMVTTKVSSSSICKSEVYLVLEIFNDAFQRTAISAELTGVVVCDWGLQRLWLCRVKKSVSDSRKSGVGIMLSGEFWSWRNRLSENSDCGKEQGCNDYPVSTKGSHGGVERDTSRNWYRKGIQRSMTSTLRIGMALPIQPIARWTPFRNRFVHPYNSILLADRRHGGPWTIPLEHRVWVITELRNYYAHMFFNKRLRSTWISQHPMCGAKVNVHYLIFVDSDLDSPDLLYMNIDLHTNANRPHHNHVTANQPQQWYRSKCTFPLIFLSDRLELHDFVSEGYMTSRQGNLMARQGGLSESW